ncbi:hypothetical protein ACFFGH_06455 [Lysobacter korlensis]|uniref:Uncharacterized protein n=1 Tax=Lysobacter korlensis TaxID=553636 RepID=A0ABV6RKI6_9GAMM
MQHAVSYQSLHDWDYERSSLRADFIERRTDELVSELRGDREANAEAWDDHTCHELTGSEVAQYLRDGDRDGLFRAVQTLVNLGLRRIAEDRAEKEVGE